MTRNHSPPATSVHTIHLRAAEEPDHHEQGPETLVRLRPLEAAKRTARTMDFVWIILGVAWAIISAVFAAAAAVTDGIYSLLDVVLPSGIALLGALAGGAVVLMLPVALASMFVQWVRGRGVFWLIVEIRDARQRRERSKRRATNRGEGFAQEPDPDPDPYEETWRFDDDAYSGDDANDDEAWQEVFEGLIAADAENKGRGSAESLLHKLRASDEWWTLTVTRDAPIEAKREARHRLNRLFHPDKFPEANPELRAAATQCQQELNEVWNKIMEGERK